MRERGSGSFKFPRKMRLSARKEFEDALREGERRMTVRVSVIGCRNGLRHPRIGLRISRRCVRHSHDRNRTKRLIREIFRLNQHHLPRMDFVVSLSRSLPSAGGGSLARDVLELLESYRR